VFVAESIRLAEGTTNSVFAPKGRDSNSPGQSSAAQPRATPWVQNASAPFSPERARQNIAQAEDLEFEGLRGRTFLESSLLFRTKQTNELDNVTFDRTL